MRTHNGDLHSGAPTPPSSTTSSCSRGGKFVIGVEDTGVQCSAKKSAEAVLRNFSPLGLDWGKGPDIGCGFGPYCRLERNLLYKQHAEKLMESGAVYCRFCSSEGSFQFHIYVTKELEKMKETLNLMKLPPVYMGKWATASDA